MKTTRKRGWVKVTILVISFILMFTTSIGVMGVNNDTQYKNAYEKIMEEDGFVYGIVVPWANAKGYATDIGAGQMPWNSTTNFDLERWTEIFTNCNAIGFNAVRIWLFEQGEGIIFDDTGDVTGIQEVFTTNLKKILDLAVTMKVNLEVTFSVHLSIAMYPQSADLYNKFTQYAFDPAKRQHFIDRVVTPVCNILKDYKQNLVALNVFAEPEGDVSGADGNMYQPYGTTWENMADHIRQVGSKVRELVTDVPITASSGWGTFEHLRKGNYNDLGLDIIGADIYNDYGDVYYNDLGLDIIGADIYNDYGDVYYDTANNKAYQSLKDLRLTKPAWISEFGAISSKNWSDDFQTQSTIGMYTSAKEAGYKGAFYWMYGYPESTESLTLVGQKGSLRPVAAAIKFLISDNRKERTGETDVLDTPTMLYGHDVLNIKWFGSRGVNHYKLERSTDKTTWSVLKENIDPESVDTGTYLCSYQDQAVEFKTDYYYRVTAYDDDGNFVTSEPSDWMQMKKITCPPEENKIHNVGWEAGEFTSAWYAASTFSLVNDPALAHEGNWVVRLDGGYGNWLYLYDKMDLKPSTEYTATIYAKAKHTSESDNSFWNVNYNMGAHPFGYFYFIYDDEWHYYTFDFRTGSAATNPDPYAFVVADSGGTIYVDDIYVFEK